MLNFGQLTPSWSCKLMVISLGQQLPVAIITREREKLIFSVSQWLHRIEPPQLRCRRSLLQSIIIYLSSQCCTRALSLNRRGKSPTHTFVSHHFKWPTTSQPIWCDFHRELTKRNQLDAIKLITSRAMPLYSHFNCPFRFDKCNACRWLSHFINIMHSIIARLSPFRILGCGYDSIALRIWLGYTIDDDDNDDDDDTSLN